MTDTDDQDVTIRALRERCADLEARIRWVIPHLEKIADCPYDDIGPWLCEHARIVLRELEAKR